MINCMVSRRLCQSRKPQGPRLVVPETPASTVPEFQKYHPEENVLSNRRFSVAPEGFGGGPFSQQPGMFSLQGITVDGRPTMLEDGDDKGKITQPNPRPNRSNKMLSKHFVAPRARLNRRASLHGCDFRTTQGISVMESGYVLCRSGRVYTGGSQPSLNFVASCVCFRSVFIRLSIESRSCC